VVHVGVGNRVVTSRLWGDVGVEQLSLVDANPGDAGQFAAAASKIAGWDSACVLLRQHAVDDTAYYVASTPTANGCIPADVFRSNLQNFQGNWTHAMPGSRLDGVLDAWGPGTFPLSNLNPRSGWRRGNRTAVRVYANDLININVYRNRFRGLVSAGWRELMKVK
jgi:hypothetical protein